MTWHYKLSDDRQILRVYDHTGTKIATRQNDGSGFSPKKAVLAEMEAEVMAGGLSGGLSDRQIAVLRDAVFENIKEGL